MIFLQVAEQDLDASAGAGEDHGLHILVEQILGQPHAFEQGGFPQPQGRVGDGWIVNDEVTRPARRAIVVDQMDRFLDQPPGQLLRIPDGRRSQDELRPGPVKICYSLQPSNDIGNMRAENAAVGMGLVDDHIMQVGEKFIPVGVMGKNAGVQHVRVGQDDAGIAADGGAVLLGGVAVIDGGCQVRQVSGVRLELKACRLENWSWARALVGKR